MFTTVSSFLCDSETAAAATDAATARLSLKRRDYL
jgi:hypothetical protein